MYYDYQEFGSCSKIQIEHAHAFKYEINFMFNDFVKNLLTPVPVKSSWNKDDPEIIFDMINYIKSNKKMWEYVDNYIALLVSNENKNWQEEAEIVYKKLREYEKNHQESSSSEKDFEDFEF